MYLYSIVHSWVINLEDPRVEIAFGKHYQIVQEALTPLPILPITLLTHIQRLSQLTTYQDIKTCPFHYSYDDDPHAYLATSCLKSLADNARCGFFTRQEVSEIDLMANVWFVVDKVFNVEYVARR